MITLEQAKVGMADKVVQSVIDEFRRANILMDRMIFDDAVSPGTGGSTLTYGYTRLKTPANAQFRDINEEYTPQVADREKVTIDLKIFGGAFTIDRVLAQTAGAVDEVQFQLREKVKSASNLFNYTVINGDNGVDSKAFDGLDKALVGSSTEVGADSSIDISTSAKMDDNYNLFIDKLDEFIAELDGKPSMLMGNSKLITKIKSIARRAGYLTSSENAFGVKVDSYDGIELVDMKYYVNDSGIAVPNIAIHDDRMPDGTNVVTGLTDLYAVRLAQDGFHGVTVTGNGVISTYLPDFTEPKAVHRGEVEMIGGVALKATRSAGVLRNIKVQ